MFQNILKAISINFIHPNYSTYFILHQPNKEGAVLMIKLMYKNKQKDGRKKNYINDLHAIFLVDLGIVRRSAILKSK
jgi:hypothetical protein